MAEQTGVVTAPQDPIETVTGEDVVVDDLLVSDLLVEEVSIDGMCGVY